MNDGTSRRTTSPVITAKCSLPLKREEGQLLHQRTTLLAAQAFPSPFSHLRTDQIWTCIISQNLAESQPVADSQHANQNATLIYALSFSQLDWLPLSWSLNSSDIFKETSCKIPHCPCQQSGTKMAVKSHCIRTGHGYCSPTRRCVLEWENKTQKRNTTFADVKWQSPKVLSLFSFTCASPGQIK